MNILKTSFRFDLNSFFRIISLIFLTSLLFQACSSVSVKKKNEIRIKGSDTMLPLMETLAGEFMRNNPGVSVYVSGGGTASGINALIKGEADISAASRTLKPDEAKELAEYYGSIGMFFLVAKDALSVYLNPQNQVASLTIGQLAGIYSCKITNWKEVGGADMPIRPVMRPPNSGTHFYFREHILQGDEYCPAIETANTTEEVIKIVENNPEAIGYGGFSYGPGIKAVSINGIEPAAANARNDSYPITRYLHLFTSNSPSGVVKEFIDWTLSPAGQRVIESAGFIPLYELPSGG